MGEFLSKHKTMENSIVIGQGKDGRRNGFGAVLFENEEAAEKAISELDKEYIGERYIMMYAMTYGQYLKFNTPVPPQVDVILTDHVKNDNKEKCLLVKNLPFRIKKEE